MSLPLYVQLAKRNSQLIRQAEYVIDEVKSGGGDMPTLRKLITTRLNKGVQDSEKALYRTILKVIDSE